MTDRRLWTTEEDEIILNLIKQHGTTQWTVIAIEMRALVSNGRTSKQIRQRWYNQLSPCITRSPWSVEEENILFISHSKLGNRWKDIGKIIHGRTDNSVKNHFYSTVRRALRRLDKHFGFKDSTKKMRSLKPAALTLLLEAARTLSDYSQMMKLILQFAQWKPSRSNTVVHNGKQIYENIIEMINTFNKNYRRGPKGQHKIQIQMKETPNGYQDNHSTLSDGQASEDSQISNYFGSITESRSWFNVSQNEWGVKVCRQKLQIICDQDHLQ